MNRKLALVTTVLTVFVVLAAMWDLPLGVKSIASSWAAAPQHPVKREIRTGADEATLTARDGSRRLFQVNIRGEGDREAARQLGALIEDYESFVVISVGQEDVAAVSAAHPDFAPMETTINLRGYSFEPLSNDPAQGADSGLKQESPGGDYYIVQFVAPVRDEWIE